jgi:hypothetical protein
MSALNRNTCPESPGTSVRFPPESLSVFGRATQLAAGAAEWAVAHVARQLEVIVDHIRTHEGLLDRLPGDERAVIEDASVTLRKARQSVPVAFGRRRSSHG